MSQLPRERYEEWVEDLRGIVWNAFKRGNMTFEHIAEKAMLHPTTVEKFAWGDTKRPAAWTVFQIAEAVGFRTSFLPADAKRQPDEQSFSRFRALVQKR